MARLRRLLNDLRRIAQGFVGFLEYLLSRDLVEIGLGQLSAESAVAVRGRQNRYLVTISNARTEPRDVTLAIDIYAIDSPTHPGGHYAHFAKRLKAQPRASAQVEIRYDWLTRASFLVGDMPSRPDDLWRGTIERSARYSVNAILLDPDGNRLELLTVYQELTP
ncbi:MAG: hypothetical protein DMD83_03485 [Candidatus Rokuibacteriota bacterium]|nr:MAG: hypothetical protein DMD83_03485 [Candidatus Rokubacteria bacterium]